MCIRDSVNIYHIWRLCRDVERISLYQKPECSRGKREKVTVSGPMEQFEIKELFPIKVGEYNIGFTNSSLCMVLSAVSVIAVFAFCLRKKTLIPGVAQSIPEIIYECIYKLEMCIRDRITRLRKKIEIDTKNPRYLQTVRGKGYMLISE